MYVHINIDVLHATIIAVEKQ